MLLNDSISVSLFLYNQKLLTHSTSSSNSLCLNSIISSGNWHQHMLTMECTALLCPLIILCNLIRRSICPLSYCEISLSLKIIIKIMYLNCWIDALCLFFEGLETFDLPSYRSFSFLDFLKFFIKCTFYSYYFSSLF